MSTNPMPLISYRAPLTPLSGVPLCRNCGADLTGSRNPFFCNGSCRTAFWNTHRAKKPRVNRTAMNAVESPSLCDLAWAAGVYEGEGHVRGREGDTIQVQIVQKDRWLLDRLVQLFGGAIYGPHGHSGCFNWYVSGVRARGFVLTIFTFLSPRRREQARQALCPHSL